MFAKRKITRGEEVCFYDGDIYEQKVEEPFHYFSKDKGRTWTKMDSENIKYLQGWRDGKTVREGYSIPRNRNGVAQLINDGAKLNLPPFKRCQGMLCIYKSEYEKAKREYETELKNKENVGYSDKKEYVKYALRDIEQE